MTQDGLVKELAEETETVLHELQIIGEQVFHQLRKIMKDIQSGRSPRYLEIDSAVDEIRSSLFPFSDCIKDLDRCIQHWIEISKKNKQNLNSAFQGNLSQLERNREFWKEYGKSVKAFLDKLNLVARQDTLSSLGRMPLEDAWEDIQKMAKLN